ncbi:TetR/AcrR family transcriptional regulator [Gordonia sp. LSe1-13]|uniref:TetR/AcrR family transcriptional regulator n=1 Tax=Gordonia sesuvii TaxID=3116777 RepID=A0ABU7ME63_9ACTN|nr:TetR/AcrR family transcriptional regulator [Gordonia sp. LSe1-13]
MSNASETPAGRRSADARPGGRTADVRRRVLTATEDALIEHGFAGIELPVIARAADVGKTTIYRRWGSPQALVSDLLDEMAAQSVRATHTGELDSDLQANADLIVRTLGHRRQGRLFAALIAAATHDSHTKRALAEFYRIRVDEWSTSVADAIDRGAIPATTDTTAVIRYLSAPLYYQFFTTTERLGDGDARRAVRATMAALGAGVFESS